MSDNATVVAYLRKQGSLFQSDVQSGSGDRGVIRAALCDIFGEVHILEDECLGGSAESPRPSPSHGMVSPSLGI